MPDDHPDAVECEHPHCQKALLDGGQTYADEHGNELVLCPKHYYELVAGKSASESRSSSGLSSRIPTGTTGATINRSGGSGLQPFGDDQ